MKYITSFFRPLVINDIIHSKLGGGEYGASSIFGYAFVSWLSCENHIIHFFFRPLIINNVIHSKQGAGECGSSSIFRYAIV